MNGFGTLTFSDNCRVYEGQFKDGEPWGEGQLTGTDFSYTGKFMNGLYEGKGTLRNINSGLMYEG